MEVAEAPLALTRMEALGEIGWPGAVRFLWWGLVTGFLRIVLVPQVRAALLRALGAKVGRDTIILNATFSNLYHYGFSRLTIGKRCFVGDEVLVDCRGWIQLGDDVTISNRACLITHMNTGYRTHPLRAYYPTREDRITIGRGTYIGTAALVLPGVAIGELSVIGAGAVVTHDVPSRCVVAGVPARVIKRLRKVHK